MRDMRSVPPARLAIVQFARASRILIIGQAPGAKVHRSGIPWSDESGNRLREWMGMDTTTFYDLSKVALVPMASATQERERMATCLPAPNARRNGIP
jgi:uracil-DNA glycosylase